MSSLMRAENQWVTSETAASATATRAMTTASHTIVLTATRATMTTWLASTGVATVRKAPATESATKISSLALQAQRTSGGHAEQDAGAGDND